MDKRRIAELLDMDEDDLEEIEPMSDRELPPMTIPEILWELQAMNDARLKRVAKAVKFPRYSRMHPVELRAVMIATVNPERKETFDIDMLNKVHEELR